MKKIDSLLLKEAINIAIEAHKGQVDKIGCDYIYHPLRVMYKCDSIEEKIVAILHDVIEDTDITLNDLSEKGFPKKILNSLDAISRRSEEKYFEYIERVKKDKISRNVKLADLSDNINPIRLNKIEDKKSVKSLSKRYNKAIKILKE